MNKKIGCTIVLSLLMVIGLGCGEKPLSDVGAKSLEDTGSNNNNQKISISEKSISSESNIAVKNLAVDSAAEPVSIPVEKSLKEETTGSQDKNEKQSAKIQVSFTDPNAMSLLQSDQVIHFANDIEKYQAAFKALQVDTNPELISLWSKMELKTVSFKSGKVTLDIHMPDEARLGAGGEQFALDALKNTLFQFEEVKSIDLLVDGAAVESLMGHADLEHPMVR